MNRKLLASASFATLTASLASPVMAQDTTAQASPNAASDDAIIVTARRREEALQDVPASIQVVTADDLIKRNITSEADLTSAVPGLLVKTNNSQNQLNYVIRGESSEPYSGSVPGVQPYFNDVALSGNTPISFFDLQSVQVLKGPQGTLFGRNSTGGAVLYRAAKPSYDVTGYASVEYGNLDLFKAEAAINVPIADQVAALRIAGKYSSGGAFIHNLYDNSKQGDSKLRAIRGTLLLEPSSSFSNELMVQHEKISGSNYGRYTFYVEPCGGVGRNVTCWANSGNADFNSLVNSPAGTYFPNYPNGYVYPGGLAGLPGFLASKGKYRIDQNGPSGYSGKSTIIVNTSSLQLGANTAIKNIFGYVKSRRDFGYDNDSTPYPFLQATGGADLESRQTRIYSDELQLQGTTAGGKLDYIVGAFYSNEKTINDSPLSGIAYSPTLHKFFQFNIRYKAQSEDKSYAVFTQGTYALTDKLNVTAGIRQTWDKLSIVQLPGSLFYGPPKQETSVDDLSWTFSLDYKVTPDLLLYATTRGSWRVGGYNPFVRPGATNTATAETSGNYFLPEKVRDIEIGAKYAGRIGTMPAHLNIAAYNLWVKQAQKTAYTVIAGNITSATVNIPAAKVTGFEVDGELSPASWLSFGGTLAYANARYTDNVAGLYGQTAQFGPYADQPKYSGTVYANAEVPLGPDTGQLNLHVDFYAQSSFHISSLGDTFNPGDKLPGYHLLNARLDWKDLAGIKGLTASVFGKNLTKEVYFTGGAGSVALYSTNAATWGMPRTYGMGLRFEY